MIIKGACRTNGSQLGSYLGNYLVAEKNHRVEMIELRGSSHRGLTNALASWEAEAAHTRCKKPLWHAQLRTPSHEHLTREQQVAAVDILEKHLGFEGQPRAIVIHENSGHQHVHVVWSRIDRQTGKARRDDFTNKKNVAASREIEERFGLQKVASPEFKNDDKSRPKEERRQEGKKAADRKEYQKAKRTTLDPIERKKTITKLWHEADSGKALRAALHDAGYILARGDNRNFVVVDKAGDIHSLARQVTTKGVLKEQIDARLADLDPASVPKAAHIQQQLRQAWREREREQKAAAGESEASFESQKRRDERVNTPKPKTSVIPEPDTDSLDPAIILAGITQGKSTFTASDLHYEIGKRLEKTADPQDVSEAGKLFNSVRALNDFIELGEDRVGRTRYTSRDLLETELSMRDSSDVLAGRKIHGVFHKVRDAAPKAQTLGTEQREAFDHATSASALSIVIGYAGTGKSHMLGAAREAWEAAGYRVRGVALSGMAAQSLQEGSAIESRTLASLFMAMDKLPDQEDKLSQMDRRIADWNGSSFKQRQVRFEMQANRDLFAARVNAVRFTERDVIVLDEAAMVGSRQLSRLLMAANEAKAKVVLVGDAEQLQAIDAGGAFRALTERHGAVKISEIRRQKEDWAKQATKNFGDGFTSEALDAYRGKGHTHELGTQAEARTRIVADWTASRQANPNDTHLMLAFTREDVATLNEQARAAYKKEGRLGRDEPVHTDAGHKDFARGDRLYFLQNDARLKVKNGSLGTVENIERFQMQNYHRMTVKLDNGETVQFSTADYKHFAHGYASTIHKSQGATANRAHVLTSQFMDRHATYVAMSRHVDQVDMYYTKDEFKDFNGLVGSLSRDRRKDTTLDYLDRAEKQGKAESFLKRIKGNVVEIFTQEQSRKQAVQRLKNALGMHKDPAARKRVEEQREQEAAARKLRDVLDGHPERKRNKTHGLGM